MNFSLLGPSSRNTQNAVLKRAVQLCYGTLNVISKCTEQTSYEHVAARQAMDTMLQFREDTTSSIRGALLRELAVATTTLSILADTATIRFVRLLSKRDIDMVIELIGEWGPKSRDRHRDLHAELRSAIREVHTARISDSDEAINNDGSD